MLYCEIGLKSARIAELMQRNGYEAYSFLGGVKALKRAAPQGEPPVPAGAAGHGGADG